MKRNAERFPEDFRFQLTAQEALAARSQTETKASGSGRNIKYLPYAFIEHGAIQAANVVNSSRAIRMSIYVVRAFVQLRSVLASNRDIAQKLVELERRIDSHDGAIVGILKTIRELMNLPERESRPIGFVPLEEKKR